MQRSAVRAAASGRPLRWRHLASSWPCARASKRPSATCDPHSKPSCEPQARARLLANAPTLGSLAFDHNKHQQYTRSAAILPSLRPCAAAACRRRRLFAAAACRMALMPAVRPPRQAQGHSEVPWGQLLVASIAVAFLVLLGTGHIRIAPSVSSTAPAPKGNSALRWADHPPSLGLPGQLPHWLGAAARPPGSRQLEDGPLLNDTVRAAGQAVHVTAAWAAA